MFYQVGIHISWKTYSLDWLDQEKRWALARCSTEMMATVYTRLTLVHISCSLVPCFHLSNRQTSKTYILEHDSWAVWELQMLSPTGHHFQTTVLLFISDSIILLAALLCIYLHNINNRHNCNNEYQHNRRCCNGITKYVKHRHPATWCNGITKYVKHRHPMTMCETAEPLCQVYFFGFSI